MRVLTTVLFSMLLFTGGTSRAEPLSLQTKQVFLHDEDHSLRRIGELEFVSGIAVSSTNRYFGGISDLHIFADGKVLAITDKGKWIRTTLKHDKEGNLIGLAEGDITPLKTPGGKALKGKKKSDAEGLTQTEDGFLVSFERRHRIWRYAGDDPVDSAAEKTPLPTGLDEMPANGGLESLLQLDAGRLLTFSEDLVADNGHTRGWLRNGDVWQPVFLTKPDDFSPTGMARLANGDVLVLERSYSVLKGPAARIRLLDPDKIKPQAVLAGREIGHLKGSMTVDNMEGISTQMTSKGERIYLISDDNFNPLQRTLILMFRFAN